MTTLPHRTAWLALLPGALIVAGCKPSPEQQVAEHQATIARYCYECHDDIERTANISLQSLDVGNVAADPAEWEKVLRKLKTGMMPPPDGPVPTADVRTALAGFVETELDRAAAAAPNPGRTEPFHRLNRSEYRNAVRDLLALEVDVAELLPADDSSYGFDNIAGVLKLSPTLLERYLAAADKISRLAVGTASPFVDIDYFRVPDDRSQEQRLPGLPFGTRGGTLISYNFPVDGQYTIAAELSRDLNEGVPLYVEDQHLEVSIDGERVALFTLPGVPKPAPAPLPGASSTDAPAPAISQIGGGLRLSREERAKRNNADADWRVRVPVTAGPHEVAVTFLARTSALDETARLPFLRPYPAGVNMAETRTGAYLRSVEISGPYDATGAGETASRRQILTCRPDETDASAECARTILSALARRAYRRPVDAADVEPLLAFFEDGAAAGGFDAGIQLAIKRLLVSPEFLFRVEREPAGVAAGAPYALDDLSLASRLSFFLWSSIPDEELLAAAERGGLADPQELERQVQRMLADQRADAFVDNFAGQWLYLRNLEAVVPVQGRFPDFDDTLREGLRRETELFFGHAVRDNLSAFELLTADYTFVNERVARHYGIGGVKGNQFRRVALGDLPRRGLLGHGSVLTVTAYPDRTSPVVRGKWVLENLLGAAAPPPPPNVPELAATDGEGTALSMRDRLAAHRSRPPCSSCHALMDPLGFSLENYDATGKWRTLGDAGEQIDAAGSLPDGTRYTGADGLRDALVSSDLFVTALTEKLMTYALGRGLTHEDMPAVRAIVRDASPREYRLGELIAGVVNSPPFRMRTAQ